MVPRDETTDSGELQRGHTRESQEFGDEPGHTSRLVIFFLSFSKQTLVLIIHFSVKKSRSLIGKKRRPSMINNSMISSPSGFADEPECLFANVA